MSVRKKPIRVECYAGSRAEEYPWRFYLDDRLVEVNRIVKRWQTPDCRCFKILADDGFYYILEYEQVADQWKIMTGNKQFGSR